MSRPGYFFSFLALGLATTLIAVVAVFPAAAAWRLVEDDVNRAVPALQVATVAGSVWGGRADFSFAALPPLALSWRLRFLPLLGGVTNTEVNITGAGIDGNFQVVASPGEQSITGSATAHSRYVNQVSVNYGLETSGQFELTGLKVTAESVTAENSRLSSVAGRLAWPGGIVHVETPAGFVTSELPPLLADIGLEGGNVVLEVAAGETRLMAVRIKPDGWAQVTVLNALMQALNLPLPGGSNVDMSAPALVFEEKLL